jgi:hypothetical protein
MLVAALACSQALAAEWKQIAKGGGAELWIDNASVKRTERETFFEYRIDYARVQKELTSGAPYRSTVTKAAVRCAARTISIGPTVAYGASKGAGKVVGTYPPTPEEARFQPVERGSSDENLWRHVCQPTPAAPGK